MSIAIYDTPEINAIHFLIKQGVVDFPVYTVRDGALYLTLRLIETDDYEKRDICMVLR